LEDRDMLSDPRKYCAEATMLDGAAIRIRAILPDDKERLREHFANAGPDALSDYELLRAHAEAGCLALVCKTARGHVPFVFVRRRIAFAPVGVMQLVYCRDTASYVALAGPLGRYLLGRAATCVILDADGPVPGLIGVFFRDRTPRYFKGPSQPRQNDLAFTEVVLFGP
jgi:hypothetical protein